MLLQGGWCRASALIPVKALPPLAGVPGVVPSSIAKKQPEPQSCPVLGTAAAAAAAQILPSRLLEGKVEGRGEHLLCPQSPCELLG